MKHLKQNTNSSQTLQDVQKERKLPNSFYEANINLIVIEKDITKKGNYH